MRSQPLIVDIKRHSLEDGPGIRSVVFFKGCPLRCVFCHNPETQAPGGEIAFSAGACVLCGACAAVCPTGAVSLRHAYRIDRERCDACGRCVDACPGKGLQRVGVFYRVEELTEILLRDRAYYRHSNGGITLSGGECTLHPGYLEALLTLLKPSGTHILLETSGLFPYEIFSSRILPHIDAVYYDLKFVDPDIHRRYTGRPNGTILNNFRRLVGEDRVPVTPRVPLVPGITATDENLAGIAGFLKKTGAGAAELLPYNPMGRGKGAAIGKNGGADISKRFMTQEEVRRNEGVFFSVLNPEGLCEHY